MTLLSNLELSQLHWIAWHSLVWLFCYMWQLDLVSHWRELVDVRCPPIGIWICSYTRQIEAPFTHRLWVLLILSSLIADESMRAAFWQVSLERYIYLQLRMGELARANHAYSLYADHVSGLCLNSSPLDELTVVSWDVLASLLLESTKNMEKSQDVAEY